MQAREAVPPTEKADRLGITAKGFWEVVAVHQAGKEHT